MSKNDSLDTLFIALNDEVFGVQRVVLGILAWDGARVAAEAQSGAGRRSQAISDWTTWCCSRNMERVHIGGASPRRERRRVA